MDDPGVTRDAATALIEDIVAVCRKHGLWISHEDSHGGFLVERKNTEDWLRECVDPRWSRYWMIEEKSK